MAILQTAQAELQKSVGDVYAVTSGELVYREFHTFSKPPEPEFMQTQYKAIDGRVIAERRVNFVNGLAGDYVFKQADLNIENEVIRGQNSIEYRGTNGDKTSTKSFSPKNLKTAVVNAGMFNAVERAWPKLIAGETVKIDLVVPERGRTFTMNLRQVSLEKSKMAKHMSIDGKVVFNLTIANRLLRLIVGPVELGYDTKSKRLVFYQGPSNIRRADGKKIGNIRISYKNS